MIGQNAIMNSLQNRIDEGSLPQFIILYGEKGSGKTLIAKELAKMLGYNLYVSDNSMDNVQEVLNTAYISRYKSVYVFNADEMTVHCKQSLLKVTEEPPKNAIFVLKCSNDRNLPVTLANRGQILSLKWYSNEELQEFYETLEHKDERILKYCSTPGQMLEIDRSDPTKFFDFCELIRDNIANVTEVNALKCTEHFKLKRDGDGFDGETVLQVLRNMFYDIAIETRSHAYGDAYEHTVQALSDYNIQGMSRKMIIDHLIINLRKVLR